VSGRNYRTYAIPDGVAIQLEKAIAIALRVNDWQGDINTSPQSARIDAIELIAVSFILSNPDPFQATVEEEEIDSLKANQLAALERDGFRCVICRHSEVNAGGVEVHHIYPRSYHGPKRPCSLHSADNLATLCHLHHESITDAAEGGLWHWANVAEMLQEAIAKNNERALLHL